ncbi:TetR/AcrR family transcriptional regulator, partial [Lactobacillus sp.]|uniref:TetR/AcrR family transcriptional regulator n=1 Tax=Lactobacillus sp. TaxID=1591 RepID=UPI003F003AD3
MSDATILEDYQGLLQSKKLPQGQKKALFAAIELFSKQGFDGTSTAQIAKRAGISQATIFKYYKTKSDLLNAVISPVAHELFPKIQEDFI